MRIHHEGTTSIVITLIIATVLFAICYYNTTIIWIRVSGGLIGITLLVVVLHFFRVPDRGFVDMPHAILSPANGKVVEVATVIEKEFLKKECTKVSIFMSPLNVHLNKMPISGKIVYSMYHPGKYLVAWAPKASEVNERHSVIITNERTSVMVTQIAGFLARRIVNYAKLGQIVRQNEELGFIKFGSRVDLFLPTDTKIKVAVGDKTIEGITVIAQYD